MASKPLNERWADFAGSIYDFFTSNSSGDTPAEKFPKGEKPEEVDSEIRRKPLKQLQAEAKGREEDRAKAIEENQEKLKKQREENKKVPNSSNLKLTRSGVSYRDPVNTDVTNKIRANINRDDFGEITQGIRKKVSSSGRVYVDPSWVAFRQRQQNAYNAAKGTYRHKRAIEIKK